MSRKPDYLSYPIRLRFRIPSTGLGGMTEATVDWLWSNADGHQIQTSYGGLGAHILTVYLRRIEDAAGFVAAFPKLEFADNAPGKRDRPAPGAPISSGHLQRG